MDSRPSSHLPPLAQADGAGTGLHIAYVLGTFPSLTETFILREISALRRKGVRIEIFALRRGTPVRIDPEAAQLATSMHVAPRTANLSLLASQFHFLLREPRLYLELLVGVVGRTLDPAPPLKALRHFLVAAHFARLAARAGVQRVHSHFAFVPSDVALVMARLLRRPFSFSAHAWDIFTRDRRQLENKIGAASFVVVCTAAGRAHLERLFPELPGDRLVQLYHGLRISDFTPGDEPQRLVLGVGRLVAKKGFADLVEACRLLKGRGTSFRCIIAGGGRRRSHLETAVSKAGLENEVAFAGERSQDELQPLYRDAALLVVPSRVTADGDRDGVPNVILEAMAMERPVVATRVGAIPEAVRDGLNGFLVPSGDPSALANRIAPLLTDSSLCRTMGRAGRKLVSEQFDIDRNVGPLIELLGAGTRGDTPS